MVVRTTTHKQQQNDYRNTGHRTDTLCILVWLLCVRVLFSSWGQGSCMSGVSSGPTSTVCHERSATSASNWYFGTCSDQCYLVCGISCTSSQNCEINRDADPPECSCVVKQGIIIGAVAGSIFLFCLLLTIFVCIRRRNALKHSKQLNVDFEYNNGPASYTTLPGGQPAHVVGYTGSYAPASLTGSTQ